MTRSRTCAGAVVVALLALVSTLGASGFAAADRTDPKPVFTITDPDVDESSSLVVSTRHPDLVYTMNDSGDDAVIYVLDRKTGDTVGHAYLSGAVADDVEAMSLGQDGSLLVGDIGDNDNERPDVEAYLTEQPGRGETTLDVHTISLSYRGGPRDAESILWDSERGRIYVVAKFAEAPRVFATDPGVTEEDDARLKPIAEGPMIATDATWLDGTKLAVVRTYTSAIVYRVPSFRQVASVTLPKQKQGETVASPDKRTIWVGSEGKGEAVLPVTITLPEKKPSSSSTSTPASTGSDTSSSSIVDYVPTIAISLVVVGLLLVALAVADWWRQG